MTNSSKVSLDRLDKKAASSVNGNGKKSSVPDLTLNSANVSKWAEAKRLYEKAKADKDIAEQDLIQEADQKRFDLSFSKSIRARSDKDQIRITWKDQFSVKGTPDEVKNIVGKEFESNFEVKREVSVKAEVFTQEDKLEAFLSKFSDDELETFFSIEKRVIAKPHLDEKLFADKKLRESLQGIANQYKPSIVLEDQK